MNGSASLLRIRELCVEFPRSGRILHEVSMDAADGEIVGLVGESGAGKTLAALAILGLVPAPGRIDGGKVFIGDRELTNSTNRPCSRCADGSPGSCFRTP